MIHEYSIPNAGSFKRIWVFPKIGKHPKMDGENNGKPYEKWDDLGVNIHMGQST